MRLTNKPGVMFDIIFFVSSSPVMFLRPAKEFINELLGWGVAPFRINREVPSLSFELWINGEYVKSCSHNFPLINKKTLKESNSKGYKDSGKVDFRYGIYRPNVGKWLMSNNKNHPQKLEYFRDPDGGESVVMYPFNLNWDNKIPTSIIYYDEMRVGKSKDEVDITMQSKPVD